MAEAKAKKAKRAGTARTAVYDLGEGRPRKTVHVRGSIDQIVKKAPKGTMAISVYKEVSRKQRIVTPSKRIASLSAVAPGDPQVPCFTNEKTGAVLCKIRHAAPKHKSRGPLRPRAARIPPAWPMFGLRQSGSDFSSIADFRSGPRMPAFRKAKLARAAKKAGRKARR